MRKSRKIREIQRQINKKWQLNRKKNINRKIKDCGKVFLKGHERKKIKRKEGLRRKKKDEKINDDSALNL